MFCNCPRKIGKVDIIDSERNVTTCSVAISRFGPPPMIWEASYWPVRFG
jgi:hypothetical protein